MMMLGTIYSDLQALSEQLQHDELNRIVGALEEYSRLQDEKKAVKGWKKQLAEIAYLKEKDLLEFTVDAYQNAKYPGVMIHRDFNNVHKNWIISHKASGRKISPANYATMRRAVNAFTRYAAHVNWDRPEIEIQADAEAKEASKALWEHWGY